MKLPSALHPKGEYISDVIRGGDFFEARLLRHMCPMFEDKVVIDLGANIGNHTVFFAQVCKQVYAIEPHPANITLLFENTAPYRDNVSIIQAMISDGPRRLKLPTRPENMGGLVAEETTDESYPPALTLDALGLRADFIKMDIEGHEILALRGATKMLTEQRPTLWLECNLYEQLIEIVNYLRGFGYYLEEIQNDGNPMALFVHHE